jgi:hypothetical protein
VVIVCAARAEAETHTVAHIMLVAGLMATGSRRRSSTKLKEKPASSGCRTTWASTTFSEQLIAVLRGDPVYSSSHQTDSPSSGSSSTLQV